MAVLKNGTTIGGNAAIHAANMADHGIITTSTVGSQSVNYATSAGNSSTTSQRSYDYLYASSYLESSGAVYGTIFYDNNDRAYYVDPNSLSNVLRIQTNQTWYENSASDWGGGINISGNNPTVGFQPTTSPWWYMLHHSTYMNFYRRNTSGSWNQDGVWDTSGNLYWYNGIIQSNSSLRAPIFYDSNDTSYYVDPDGSSRVSTLNVVNTLNTGNVIDLGYTVNGSISTTAFRGINFHSFGDLNYYIGKPAGDWTQPLDIHFYTGIRLKSHGSYGGTRFINLSNGNTLMTVGDGTDYVKVTEKLQVSSTMNINYDQVWTSSGNLHLQYSGSGNIDMNYGGGYTFSRTSLRAPIFYDFDDTNYYGDFAGTSKLYRITNTGALGGNELNARNHFRQFNAGTDTPSSGWIAAAFGDESANRVVIGQWGSTTQAIIGSHTGGLDDWGPLGYAATEHKFYSSNWETERVRVDSSGLLVSNGTIRLGGYIEQDGISMNLRRVNSITFAPNNSWDHPYNHGIMSTDSASNNSDSISINSWNDITLRLDSNDNNGESYLRIMNNTSGSNTIAYIGHDGGSAVAWFQGVVTAGNDFRAPIFYDSQNTGYYLDPASTSNLWKLYVNAKYGYFGSSSNWDSGSLSGNNDTITNVHFQGHIDFWIGAGNTKWYTGAVSAHHDLLINTMQSNGSNTRGITFTASLDGASVYRLGRWFANNTQATSYLQVDGSIKIGATSDYYSTPVAKLHVTGATSGADVLAIDGVNGRLFTVTDDLTDSLFSVNTIAGLPAMEIFADNKIVLGKYGTTAPSNYINSTLIIKDAQENASAQTLGLIGSKSAGAAIGFFTNDLGYPYPNDQARFAQISLNNGNWEFYSGGGIPVVFNQSPVLLSERIEVSGVVYAWDRLAVNTDNLSYTATDNTPVVGSTTNNKVFINGSIQLINNNDAIVFGRGTSTFLKDEELAFGWGGGWYMTETSYIRSRNGKSLHMNGGSVDYVGSLYLEGSGTNGHLQPNAGSYGSFQITGSKNSWAGIRFDHSNVNLMANSNESGFHNNSYGWQFRWENGTIYCHKNSYGGGTQATVLDSSNFTSWAAEASHSHSYVPLSGGTLSGNLLTQDVFPTEDRAYDLGRDTGRYRIVYCETLDSAGLHETNLESEGLDQLETGTVLVWKGGKNLPCTVEADHMKMGVAVYGHNAPLVQGAEPVLCTGEVNEGDYLITSAKEGHAKAVNRAYIVENQLFDCVLGKALETASGESHLVKTWITI